MNTHNLKIGFGKHNGELWTRVPVSYLKWVANTKGFGPETLEIANAELKRRGTVTPEIEISGHAIDSASLRLRKIWHETALSPEEGLHAWLCRICMEALAACVPDEDGAVFYKGMKLVFIFGEIYPTLKTCMQKKEHHGPCIENTDTQRAEGQRGNGRRGDAAR